MKGTGPKTYTIEMGRGETYRNGRWTVYSHDRYPRGSVLEGQDRRTFEDSYDSLELAQAAWPQARVIEGTTWRPIREIVAHLPDTPDW